MHEICGVFEIVLEFGIVLTGQTDEEKYNRRNRRLIWSYGQDLIHGVCNARIKTPKHIALPFVIKTLTGNVKLIEYLN